MQSKRKISPEEAGITVLFLTGYTQQEIDYIMEAGHMMKYYTA